MPAAKLINFKCSEEMERQIEAFGREYFLAKEGEARKNPKFDYDRSSAVRALIQAGLDAIKNETVTIEKQQELTLETLNERVKQLEGLLAKK